MFLTSSGAQLVSLPPSLPTCIINMNLIAALLRREGFQSPTVCLATDVADHEGSLLDG
jgi:hypothetical protein